MKIILILNLVLAYFVLRGAFFYYGEEAGPFLCLASVTMFILANDKSRQ